MRGLVILGLAMALAAPARAQEQEPAAACTATDVSLPAGLNDWNGKAAIGTAPGVDHLAHAALAIGKGYEADVVWELLESWLKSQPGGHIKAREINTPKLVGVAGNPGLA